MNTQNIFENKSLMVIDDEKNVCNELADLFRDKGCIVQCAYNGVQAKELIDNNSIDLVLLDLKLPDVNGFDLLERIKSKAKSDTYIIIITGYADLESALKALREKVYDYLIKPINPYDLVGTVRNALSKQAIERELEKKIIELEKFQQAATGREMKMIELKKEIVELKNKINRLKGKHNLTENEKLNNKN